MGTCDYLGFEETYLHWPSVNRKLVFYIEKIYCAFFWNYAFPLFRTCEGEHFFAREDIHPLLRE